MAFRTDQWENLYTGGTGAENLYTNPRSNGSGVAVPGANNYDFIYPNRIIRNPVGGNDLVLKRGYIRNLTTEENKMKLPSTKCQFQFNPQYLVQSVSQNTTILNFLQQDPAQYAQPIPGNVSFNFELFFDRSMELNSANDSEFVDPNSPWENSSPRQVGVLHDIAVFYSVIGVGLSDAMQEYSKNILERNINQEIKNRLLDAAGDNESTYTNEDAESQYSEGIGNASTFLSYNAGNTAFLLPLPVRIVFSSLYIVEGLVKDVTVTFTKFNAAMVPMQCTLNVNFEAKYIGFAKKNTFFTQVLGDYEASDFRDVELELSTTEIGAYYEAISHDLKDAILMVVNQGDSANADASAYNWLLGSAYLNPASANGNYYLGPQVANLMSNQDYNPDLKVEDRSLFLKVIFPGGRDGSELATLAVDKNVTISVEASADFWRFTDTFKNWNKSLFTAYEQALANQYTTSLGQTNVNAVKIRPGQITPAYPQAVRSAMSDIFSKLWSWESDNPSKKEAVYGDNDGSIVELNGVTYYGTPRVFKEVHRIWSAKLDSSHFLEKVATGRGGPSDSAGSVEQTTTPTGDDEIANMFKAGLTGTKAIPVDPVGDLHYDRSIDRSNTTTFPGVDKVGDKFPELTRDNVAGSGTNNLGKGDGDVSPFYFAMDYTLKVTVSIDGQDLPTQYIRDGWIMDQKGLNITRVEGSNLQSAELSTKRIKLSWGADEQELYGKAASELNQWSADLIDVGFNELGIGDFAPIPEVAADTYTPEVTYSPNKIGRN